MIPEGAAAGLAPEVLAELFERIRQGDREAYLLLTRAYQKKVFALAYAFFRNKEDALDLVQETFLRLFQKIDSYQEGRNFEAWLLQVARNLCIDHYRKNHLRRELECATPVEELPVAAAGAEEAIHASDLKDVLSRCVERLADRQRQIFIMRHYNQLKNEEIAQALDISLGTVKSLHFKAIRNLRVLMEPYMGYRT
ncbi:MAG: RNA polymerase sigma factor [Acidobacteriota bacterium]|nr:RNA polymerase sigma factor [Acidobacteriota bacterium]